MVVKAERGSRNRKAKSNSSRTESITQLFPKSPALPSYPRFSQGPKALSSFAGADSELGSAEGIALAPLLILEVPLPEFSFSPHIACLTPSTKGSIPKCTFGGGKALLYPETFRGSMHVQPHSSPVTSPKLLK